VTTARGDSGRRLTPKGEATRRRIVVAAAHLMARRGVAEATLEEVRAAAGVSGSQIYHYFAGKQALVRAVIEHQTRKILGDQGNAPDSLPALRAWRDAQVARQRRAGCRGGCPIAVLGAEVGERDPAARIAVADGFRQWTEALRDGLRVMRARGELAATADPERLALALLAALQGGLLVSQMQRSTRPLRAALDAVLDRIESLAVPAGAPPEPACGAGGHPPIDTPADERVPAAAATAGGKPRRRRGVPDQR
jgi:AcrR family transcriptional regulator